MSCAWSIDKHFTYLHCLYNDRKFICFSHVIFKSLFRFCLPHPAERVCWKSFDNISDCYFCIQSPTFFTHNGKDEKQKELKLSQRDDFALEVHPHAAML